ncbi:MAG: glutamate racemase [Clostridium sp.]|nr:glutamate racemase [Clostridium sp.]
MDNKSMPIGFFDSGVGGLSVLKEAIKLMPNENYIYFGDSKNAPYGVKNVDDVKELTYNAFNLLREKGAKAVVVACNTATSAAVADLRKDYKDIPIVGIEPALKPAVELNRDGAIVIMATPMTLREKKFGNLMNKYNGGKEIIPMPCAGLVEFIESGDLDGDDLKDYLKDKFSEFKGQKIGSVVLGCTHYPFVRKAIQETIGNNIPVIDGGLGTCKELRRRLANQNLINDSTKKGNIEIYNSLKDQRMIDISKALLKKEM